jgi:hypothetical protein
MYLLSATKKPLWRINAASRTTLKRPYNLTSSLIQPLSSVTRRHLAEAQAPGWMKMPPSCVIWKTAVQSQAKRLRLKVDRHPMLWNDTW